MKYVRATARTGPAAAGRTPSDLLDVGEALAGGDSEGEFDLDLGIIATAGAVRLGAVARNVREPEFAGMTLPRHFRVGAAIDTEAVGGPPLTIAVDADVRRYGDGGRERRVAAGGVEYWLFQRRLGVRAGGRVNTVGLEERSATAGISIAPRAGLFLEAHVVHGGSAGEQGWGVGARISF